MLSQRIEQAMNRQMMMEIESSYTYLAMSARFESLALPGFAAWFRAQSGEEWAHAMKFYDWILDHDATATLDAIAAPKVDFASPLEAFEAALEQEQAVTRSINEVYGLSGEEKDFASQSFLNWFVTEQVEEEKTVRDILDWLRRIGDSGYGLYLMDRELAQNPPAGSTAAEAEPTAAG
ncbi:MAG TPA: ferritin [Actinomycetota bacterium]